MAQCLSRPALVDRPTTHHFSPMTNSVVSTPVPVTTKDAPAPKFPWLEMCVIMLISGCDDLAYFQIFPYLGKGVRAAQTRALLDLRHDARVWLFWHRPGNLVMFLHLVDDKVDVRGVC